MLTEEDIELFVEKLHGFQNRPRTPISFELLSASNPNNWLENINLIFDRESGLLDEMINKTLSFTSMMIEAWKEMINNQEKMSIEIEAQAVEIEVLREKVLFAQKEKESLEQSGNYLNEEVLLLQDSISNLHENIGFEKEMVKLRLENEFSQRNYETVSLIALKHDNMKEEYQVAQLVTKMKEKEEELLKGERILTQEKREKEELRSAIEEKENVIGNLQSEIEELKEILRDPFEDPHLSMFQPLEDEEEKMELNDPRMAKVKLSEEVGKNFDFHFENIETKYDGIATDRVIEYNSKLEIPLDRSHSAYTEIITEKSVSKSPSRKYRKPVSIDPYFCHFILLSQSLKITENEEVFYNIDIKPYYKEIVSQKIPMQEWAQWILEKFKFISSSKTKKLSEERNEYRERTRTSVMKTAEKVVKMGYFELEKR